MSEPAVAKTIDSQIQSLRSRGYRITKARIAVLEGVVALPDHSSSELIYDWIQHHYPDVDRSTVYRTLETLTEADVLSHVHVGRDGAVYHLKTESHWHVICTNCRRLFDLPSDLLDTMRSDIAAHSGIEIDDHFALSGTCCACLRPRR